LDADIARLSNTDTGSTDGSSEGATYRDDQSNTAAKDSTHSVLNDPCGGHFIGISNGGGGGGALLLVCVLIFSPSSWLLGGEAEEEEAMRGDEKSGE
jgi:hypothetical protein